MEESKYMKTNKRNLLGRTLFTMGLFLIGFVLHTPDKASAEEITYKVTDHYVTGDGSTDDTYAINALLDKAATLADGDVLVLEFPAGRYNVTNWLHIYSNTTLKLDKDAEIYRADISAPIIMNVGSNGTKQKTSASGGGYKLSQNIKIIGGTFNGGNISKALNSGNVINISHAQNVLFDGVTVKNSYGAHLIELSGVKNATIRNCSFSGFRPKKATRKIEEKALNNTGYAAKECIQLDYTYSDPKTVSMNWCPGYYSDKTPCKDILIEKNTFTNYPRGVGNHHGRESFSKLYTKNVTIRNNTFKNMYVKAPNGKTLYENVIYLHSFRNAVVENNTITNAGTGICLSYDTNSKVRNNKITNVKSCGIIASNYSSGGTISGNTISDTVRFGIRVKKHSKVTTVTKNNIHKNNSKLNIQIPAGIAVDGSAGSYIKNITNNTISDTAKKGIALNNVSYTNSITGNKISNSHGYGVYVANTKTLNSLSNNRISNSSKQGIYVSNTQTLGSVSGNKVSNSLAHGVYLSKITNVNSVSNNEVATSSKHGITLTVCQNVKTVSNNKVSNAKKYGIYVFNTLNLTTLTKNTVYSCDKADITLYQSNCTTLSDNVITGSPKQNGIYVTKKSKVKTISNNDIKNSGQNGISVSANAVVKSITKNTIENSKKNGICVSTKGKVTSITSNHVIDSAIGISILNTHCKQISKNEITTTKKYGICSTTATVDVMHKNKLTSYKRAGIVFCKKSKGKQLYRNVFKKGKGKDILKDDSSKFHKKKASKKKKKKTSSKKKAL